MYVIGIGDSVVDQYPQEKMQYPGGNSANFCVYASLIGCKSSYLGVFGNDTNAKLIRDSFDSYHVDYSRSRRADLPTNKCIVKLSGGNREIEDSVEYDLFTEHPIILDETDYMYIAHNGLVHTSIYAHIENQLAKIKNTGVYIAYDFSDRRNKDLLDQVCPNIDFGFFSLDEIDSEDVKEFMRRIRGLGCRIVIGTAGRQGALVYNGRRFYSKKPYNLSSQPRNTMGAGDAFLTGFTVCFARSEKSFQMLKDTNLLKMPQQDLDDYEDWLIESSMSFGNILASHVCQIDSAFGHGVPFEE